MSESKDGDVLVFFKLKGQTKAIRAESTSEIDPEDDHATDFTPGYYFSTDNFSFQINLADDEGQNVFNQDEDRSYGRWRSLKTDEAPKPPFMADPDDINLTRMIDASSPVLLQHCLEAKPFADAVLIKRARVSDKSMLQTILRFEFKDVYIKAVEWEDDDAVKETIKFKFNAVTARYFSQGPGGDLVPAGEFKWVSKAAKAQ